MRKYICILLIFYVLSFVIKASEENLPENLGKAWRGFNQPQDSTRTKVWWFHGETETTREGISADLEAFRKAGVGGVVYYDQVHLKKPVALEAFSTEWWEMLYVAAAEAKRLGLTFEAHVSNGFVAGGPWITPELGMQYLAASDTLIKGNQSFNTKLPLPANKYSFHADVAVLAFPVDKENWEESHRFSPRISCNLSNFDAGVLFEKDSAMQWIPAQEKGKSVYIHLDFDSDFTARSISYQLRSRGKATTSATNVPGPSGEVFVGTGYQVLPDLGSLEASDDGIHYREICRLKPMYKAHSSWKQKTIAFPETKARHFRLNLHDWYLPTDGRKDMQIGNIVLSPRAYADQWEEKAGLFSEYIEADHTPDYTHREIIHSDKIIDLSHLLQADGSLCWEVPQGDWVIMRFVHQPTGGRTKHGRANLMGLECDKMSVRAVTVQWEHYFKQILDSLRLRELPIQGMAMDSHEAGSQNWTPGFEKEFHRLRGYDILPFLPALAGYVVDNSAKTDSLLHDVRRSIADLISEHYYGTLDSLCRAENLRFTAQATGNALCIVADPIQAKGRVDKPQGEFWAIHPDGNYDIKESSSAAHIYNKSIASAEAFTDAQFGHSPAFLKSLADYAYCYGINEFVVCASAYQPWPDKIPGSTGGGRHYCLNRNNTYWDYLRPFWDYQARCAYMMRQGESVNDICLYLGENAPVKILTHRLPDIPAGYDFDAFTADALHSRFSVRDSLICLPDGKKYQMMILPRNGNIQPEAQAKIAAMEAQGAHIYRNWSQPLHEALQHIQPDIKAGKTDMKAAKLWFAHRRLEDGDIYFLHNHSAQTISDTFTFRAQGTEVQWWEPVEGKRYTLPFLADENGLTIALALAPWQSGFAVIVRDNESREADENLLPIPMTMREEPLRCPPTWSVYFDPKMGGPGMIRLDSLTDWRHHEDARVRNYSGTAVYTNTFTAPRFHLGEQVFLQFDTLGDVARVRINGKEAGIVWCSPWQLDISPYLKKGKNHLEISVANSLMNRMIADEALPQEERITFAFPSIIKADSQSTASGIIGPLRLVIRK